MSTPFHVVIPARLASVRLPRKALLDLAGAPMIVRVWQRACASGAASVWVATDDEQIVAAIEHAGGQAMMTAASHTGGTDRIAEVAQRLQWGADEIVVNVQGDEPLIEPALIRDLAAALAARADSVMATAAHPLHAAQECANPNIVKVVCDCNGQALYFSRAPIPWARDHWQDGLASLPAAVPYWRHIGIYAYRAGFLARYAALPPVALEQCEALEQLRVLWHGERIFVHQLQHEPPAGVDTEADLARVRAIFDRHEARQ